ncbi:hypothetical protein [Emticicia sp. W12TSBA100-4]|uniref:hypothetical protein n=1 Tax=Emticicia sp. W12TSBA100-4 TaxID=3160965 RepID=UPI0033055E3F
MKKILILLLSFAVFSCTKKDVEPELSAQVEGTYQVYYVELFGDSINLPIGGVSSSIQLLKVSENKVNFIFTINDNGDKTTETSTFELKKNGDDIEIYEDGEKAGFVRGTLFEYNLDDEVIIKAKK